VPALSAEEYYCRSIFIPYNDHIIGQLNDRFNKHQDVIDSFSSLLPSGRHLVKPQIESFLKLAGFHNTDVPECNDVILEVELKFGTNAAAMKKLQEFRQKLRLKP
jgi:hypothetical protein